MTSDRLRALDGVRGAAAMWVVFGHLWGLYFSVHSGLFGLLTNWIVYPHFAVDVFIVLSGFCLTLPTIASGAIRGTVPEFYLRRAIRILPPLYASIAIGIALFWLTARYGTNRDRLTSRMVFVNLLIVQDWFPALNRINAVTWSVALEFKIYFLFPLILLIRRKWGWLAVGTLSAILGYGAVVIGDQTGTDISRACPWYVLLFVLGCAAAELSHRSHSKRLAAIVLAISLIAVIGLVVAFPVTASTRAVADAAEPLEDFFCGVAISAALFVLVHANRFRKVFETRSLVYVGTVSYSLYLIHLPVLYCARIAVNRFHNLISTDPQRFAAVTVLGLPMLAFCTLTFFWTVERPFLQRRKSERMRELSLDAAVSPAP